MPKKGFAPLIAIIIVAIVIGTGIIVHQSYKTRNKAITTFTSTTLGTEVTTTTTELSTTTINQQKAKIFKCGDSITFTYKGSTVTYGTVLSLGKCWLDRNLGASRVATAFNDSQAYGDLFQWGRLDDGHQTRTSGTTTNLSSTDNPGHSKFITTSIGPFDWRSPQNNNLWQGVSGINNPCPSGWRIPTSVEWDAERLSWSQRNYIGAFASPLRLTAAGERLYYDAMLNLVGSFGFYWSSTVSGTAASNMYFVSDNAYGNRFNRADGFSVRCLKD